MKKVVTHPERLPEVPPGRWAHCCATLDPRRRQPNQMSPDPLQDGAGEGHSLSAWLSPSSGAAQAIYLRLPSLKTLLSKLAVTPR